MRTATLPLIIMSSVTLMNIGYTAVMTMERQTSETLSKTGSLGHKLNSSSESGRGSATLAQIQDDLSQFKEDLADLESIRDTTTALADETQKVRNEMIALNNRIESVENARESGQMINIGEADSDAAQSYRDNFTPSFSRDQQNDQQSMTLVESIMNEEALDEQRSSELNDNITDMIDQLELHQTQLAQVSCHTNLCRVKIDHTDAQSADEFTLYLSTLVSDQLPQANYYQKENGNGGISSTIYLARDGFDMTKTDFNY